jgi:hypothetical protein
VGLNQFTIQGGVMKKVYLSLFLLLVPFVLMAQVPAMPMPAATPGRALALTKEAVCAARPAELRISFQTLGKLMLVYNVKRDDLGNYQIDRLIPVELGGTNDEENLWLQPYVPYGIGAKQKDQLEVLLKEMVCKGSITVADAQKGIASDWFLLYKQLVPVK